MVVTEEYISFLVLCQRGCGVDLVEVHTPVSLGDSDNLSKELWACQACIVFCLFG